MLLVPHHPTRQRQQRRQQPSHIEQRLQSSHGRPLLPRATRWRSTKRAIRPNHNLDHASRPRSRSEAAEAAAAVLAPCFGRRIGAPTTRTRPGRAAVAASTSSASNAASNTSKSAEEEEERLRNLLRPMRACKSKSQSPSPHCRINERMHHRITRQDTSALGALGVCIVLVMLMLTLMVVGSRCSSESRYAYRSR